MSHCINGYVIEKSKIDSEILGEIPWIDLKQGFVFIPDSNELYTYIKADNRYDMLQALSYHSKDKTVAHVWTDYFGGAGEQGASSILHEYHEDHKDINAALNRIGVNEEKGCDLFDALGLGKHRSNESMIKEWKKKNPDKVKKIDQEKLDFLNAHQNAGRYHPLTCCSHNGCDRNKHNSGILVATESGWICPCGKYTQEFGSEIEMIERVKDIPDPLNILVDDSITEDKLKELGFELRGKDHIKRDTWRLAFPFEKFGERAYPFEIDFSWNPKYGNHNPNVGIVSIHSPEFEAKGVPPELYEKEEWTAEDHERAANYTITCKEWTQPVAWKVITMSRLTKIIVNLTGIDRW